MGGEGVKVWVRAFEVIAMWKSKVITNLIIYIYITLRASNNKLYTLLLHLNPCKRSCLGCACAFLLFSFSHLCAPILVKIIFFRL